MNNAPRLGPSYKCRGGPWHGKWYTVESKSQTELPIAVRKKWGPKGYELDKVPAGPIDEFEIKKYILKLNWDTNKVEWIYEDHLQKLQKRWDTLMEIEELLRELDQASMHYNDRRLHDVAMLIMQKAIRMK